jgi:RNA polymerase sigma factor (sigma-70 family)
MSTASDAEPWATEIEKVGRRDPHAVRAMVTKLTPLIHATVARRLLRARGRGGWDAHQEVKDFVQQVMAVLFGDGARVLRQWDPARGRSFTSYVCLIAEREVLSTLRTRARNPWAEEPIEIDADVDLSDEGEAGPESVVASREALATIVRVIEERLKDRGLELFQLLVVEERPVEEVAEIAGMTAGAVYAWHGRFRRMVHEILRERASDSGPPQRRAGGSHA